MRGAGRVPIDGAAEAGEAPNEQRNFSFEPGHKTDDDADLANRKGARETFGFGSQRLSPSFAPQFRDPSSEQRRRSSNHPGNARTRRYLNDAGLHARGSATVKSRPPEI